MYKLLVEFLGTLLFIGTIAFTGNPALFIGALAIAIGFGGKISGGHFNPAVTTWAYLSGKLSGMDALSYVGVQLAAAALVVFLGASGAL